MGVNRKVSLWIVTVKEGSRPSERRCASTEGTDFKRIAVGIAVVRGYRARTKLSVLPSAGRRER